MQRVARDASSLVAFPPLAAKQRSMATVTASRAHHPASSTARRGRAPAVSPRGENRPMGGLDFLEPGGTGGSSDFAQEKQRGSRSADESVQRAPLFGFTGYVADNETGLMYARARQYSPGLGRFVSRDSTPSDFGSKPTTPIEGGGGGSLSLFVMQVSGYIDGMGLYDAYFAPNALDPFGNECWTWCTKKFTPTGSCTRWVFAPLIFGKGTLFGLIPFPIPSRGSGFWHRKCLYDWAKSKLTTCNCPCPPTPCSSTHSFEGGSEYRSQTVFANGYDGPPGIPPEPAFEESCGYENGGPNCCKTSP
jgi:RHS repeat-associated protein